MVNHNRVHIKITAQRVDTSSGQPVVTDEWIAEGNHPCGDCVGDPFRYFTDEELAGLSDDQRKVLLPEALARCHYAAQTTTLRKMLDDAYETIKRGASI